MAKFDIEIKNWCNLVSKIKTLWPQSSLDALKEAEIFFLYPGQKKQKMGMDDFRMKKSALSKVNMNPVLKATMTEFYSLFKSQCVGDGNIDEAFIAEFKSANGNQQTSITNKPNNIGSVEDQIMDEKKQILGIDLGTTYSCVAVLDEYGQPRVLQNREGTSTTPSVVSFEDDDSALVGADAKNRWRVAPEKTVACIKRHMTMDESFIKPTKFPLGWDPCEFSAIILKKLVNDANEALDREENPIKDVVITCPAYFDAKARARTKQAGEAAGLNVLQIINEPTAAAIAYGIKQDENQTVLVYDLGGGTFDVTILKISGNEYETVATGGDPFCGGYDWDKALAAKILDVYNKTYNTDFIFPATEESALEADPKIQRMRASLLMEAERLKMSLTGSKKGSAETSWLFEEDGHSCPKTVITREDFDAMTSDLLDSTIEKVEEVIAAAKAKGVDHIDRWILVGGSSYMQQVKSRIDEKFNCDAKISDPNQCVAKGAAIFAATLAGGKKDDDPIIYDVCSKTYGTDVGVNGVEKVENLIFANDRLPAETTAVFTTTVDNQSAVSMEIYESEAQEQVIDVDCAELINQNNRLQIKSRLPKGSKITVKFLVDNTGIMHVTATAEDGSLCEFNQEIRGLKSESEMKESIQKIEKASATNL